MIPPDGPGRPRYLSIGLPCGVVAALSLLAGGCSQLERWGESPEVAPPRSPVEEGALLMREEAWGPAENLLRQAAARCEQGDDARRALLLLSTLHLDPRNPGGVADTAALMAMRHFAFPGTTPPERLVSEELYVFSLGMGADPELRPWTEGAGDPSAPAIPDCVSPSEPLALPGLPAAARSRTWVGVEEERRSLSERTEALAERNRALEQRAAELEAELARIRRLLGAGRDSLPILPPTTPPR